MTWEELVKEADKYGWVLITPTKQQVDIISEGHEWYYFTFKYDEFLANEDIPLTFYKKSNAIFCDYNDVDKYPTLIQMNVPFENMLEIMKNLDHE